MADTYERTWRAKWLTDDAASIEEMAEKLEYAAQTLRAMSARGVMLAGPVSGDYATLETTDPAVAEEFGFEPLEERGGEDDEDDEYGL